jgi:hypothetical protein
MVIKLTTGWLAVPLVKKFPAPTQPVLTKYRCHMTYAADKVQLNKRRNIQETMKYQGFVVSNGMICILNFTTICELVCIIFMSLTESWFFGTTDISRFRINYEAIMLYTFTRPPWTEDWPMGIPLPTQDKYNRGKRGHGSLSPARFKPAILVSYV